MVEDTCNSSIQKPGKMEDWDFEANLGYVIREGLENIIVPLLKKATE